MKTNSHIEQPLLLVVDDTPSNLLIIYNLLKELYQIKVATNGRDAIQITRNYPQPQLILLDIMMPVMDGYQTCAQLKADPETRDIPVIFLTAMTEEADEQKGLSLGAVDYITKPIRSLILKARIHNQLALRTAQLQLQQINHSLLQERQLIEDIITRMRSAKPFDERFLRYLVSSVERTNGDILLSTFTPYGEQWILIGDFTGHGLPAALGAPIISYIFYSHAAQGTTLESVIEEINLVLYQQFPVNIFMAGCFVKIDQDRTQFQIWNAGMPQCLLIKNATIQHQIVSQNLPFGVTPLFDIAHGYQDFSVTHDARLYIFSDGLIEISKANGELFGIDRAEQFFIHTAYENLPLDNIWNELHNFRNNSNFDDDITIVEINFSL